MPCPLCLEDMDLEDFRDERKQTETSFQLQCGHAFHTRCLVDTLSRTQMECPACNHYKTPETKLKLKGLLAKARAEISRDPEVRELAHEVSEAKNELAEAGRVQKKKVRQQAQDLAKELAISDKRDYFNKATRQLEQLKKAKAMEKGPEQAGAFVVERRHRNNWETWRLRHPHAGHTA